MKTLQSKKGIVLLTFTSFLLLSLFLLVLLSNNNTKLENRSKALVNTNSEVEMKLIIADNNITDVSKNAILRINNSNLPIEGFDARIVYDPAAVNLNITKIGLTDNDIFLVKNINATTISVQVGFINTTRTDSFDIANIQITKNPLYGGSVTNLVFHTDSYLGIKDSQEIRIYSTSALTTSTVYPLITKSSLSSSSIQSSSNTSSSICPLCQSNFNYLTPDLYTVGASNGLIDIRDFLTFRQNINRVQCKNNSDYTLDCKVDIHDFIVFRKYYGKKTTDITTEFQNYIDQYASRWPRCDVNKDNKIDKSDGEFVNQCLNQQTGTSNCRYADLDGDGTVNSQEIEVYKTKCSSIF